MPPDKPLLRVSSLNELPGPALFDDWALPGRPYSYIALLDLARKHMAGKRAETLSFDDICAKPRDWFGTDDFTGARFEAADTQYPGIVVRDMPNPCNRPYHMVDGRRRMEKLRRSGKDSGKFFVLDYADCEAFIFDFELVEEGA